MEGVARCGCKVGIAEFATAKEVAFGEVDPA